MTHRYVPTRSRTFWKLSVSSRCIAVASFTHRPTVHARVVLDVVDIVVQVVQVVVEQTKMLVDKRGNVVERVDGHARTVAFSRLVEPLVQILVEQNERRAVLRECAPRLGDDWFRVQQRVDFVIDVKRNVVVVARPDVRVCGRPLVGRRNSGSGAPTLRRLARRRGEDARPHCNDDREHSHERAKKTRSHIVRRIA